MIETKDDFKVKNKVWYKRYQALNEKLREMKINKKKRNEILSMTHDLINSSSGYGTQTIAYSAHDSMEEVIKREK